MASPVRFRLVGNPQNHIAHYRRIKTRVSRILATTCCKLTTLAIAMMTWSKGVSRTAVLQIKRTGTRCDSVVHAALIHVRCFDSSNDLHDPPAGADQNRSRALAAATIKESERGACRTGI
jgi:hypothetical protein